MSRIRNMLSLHEGRRRSVYRDSLGYLTIGVGHLVDAAKGGGLPEHIIDLLLDYDIEVHTRELLERAPWVAQLGEVRQAVMVDMAFNLGVEGLLKFRNTLRAAQEGRWGDAANGMLASKWATQVGSRAVRLAQMMRTGQWAPDIKE